LKLAGIANYISDSLQVVDLPVINIHIAEKISAINLGGFLRDLNDRTSSTVIYSYTVLIFSRSCSSFKVPVYVIGVGAFLVLYSGLGVIVFFCDESIVPNISSLF